MTPALRYAVRSDVGLIREGNEDSAYAGPHLLAIADGMGGHAAGEVASAVAISALKPLDASTEGVDLLQALAEAVVAANGTLREITASDPSTEGMGTTLTALLWSGADVGLCHIGDSRAYLLRDGKFYQITHDHTLVQSLVDEGRLTREAAATHPQRSLVMRALQSSVPADPDLIMLQAQLGDRYLLCSDGLSDVVTDETLRQTLISCPDLDEAVEQLIDLAIRSGGPDNITCVLADVVDSEAGPPPSAEPIIVGALADDAGMTPLRSDSPAARAHQLTHGQPRPTVEVDADTPASPDRGEPDSADTGRPAFAEDQDPDWEKGVAGASHRRRRRYPVVTSSLAILALVVIGSASFGWQMTRDLYYVGVADGHVAVFRGLNDPVAGLRLSSVVQRTTIPVTAVPKAEADQITGTIQAGSLDQAHQIVQRIQQGYQCARASDVLGQWIAHQPKPAPSAVARTGGKSGGKSAGTKARAGSATRSGGHPATGKPASGHSATTRQSYPPRPALPGYCAALTGITG